MKPYYLTIKDPKEYLKHYLDIYTGDYNKARAHKIVSLFPGLEDKKILDVGCGGGYYSLIALKKGATEVALVDMSHVCIKAAKINFQENASYFHGDGIVADATNLPFKNGYFDFVLCVDLIEHVEKDEPLLNEIWRVLNVGGFIVLATQNNRSLNYLLEAPIQRYVFKNHDWMGWDSTHERFYNSRQLHQLLKKSGFRVISITGTYFIPYLLASWFRKINRRISELAYYALYTINQKLELNNMHLNYFGWGIICSCRKRNGEKASRIENADGSI